MVWKERLHPTYILKPRLHHTVSPIDFVIHTENTFYPFSLVSPKKKKSRNPLNSTVFIQSQDFSMHVWISVGHRELHDHQASSEHIYLLKLTLLL